MYKEIIRKGIGLDETKLVILREAELVDVTKEGRDISLWFMVDIDDGDKHPLIEVSFFVIGPGRKFSGEGCVHIKTLTEHTSVYHVLKNKKWNEVE